MKVCVSLLFLLSAEWVGALLCLQSDLSGLQGGDRGREGGTDGSCCRAGSSGVLTAHLTCMGTEQPLLPSCPTAETRGSALRFTPLILFRAEL